MNAKNILILIGASVGVYFLYKVLKNKDEQTSGFASCRAGTCPYKRPDGSVFCTSAACKKSEGNKSFSLSI